MENSKLEFVMKHIQICYSQYEHIKIHRKMAYLHFIFSFQSNEIMEKYHMKHSILHSALHSAYGIPQFFKPQSKLNKIKKGKTKNEQNGYLIVV